VIDQYKENPRIGELRQEFVDKAMQVISDRLHNEQAQEPPHDRFHELVAEMVATHDAKNKDYADSKKDPLRNFRRCEKIGYPAHIGCFTRMGDKWMRCENLLARMNKRGKKNKGKGKDRGPAVKNESVIDTLKDLSVYCLIMIELLEQYEAKKARKAEKKARKERERGDGHGVSIDTIADH
jgi:hypothetical protein